MVPPFPHTIPRHIHDPDPLSSEIAQRQENEDLMVSHQSLIVHDDLVVCADDEELTRLGWRTSSSLLSWSMVNSCFIEIGPDLQSCGQRFVPDPVGCVIGMVLMSIDQSVGMSGWVHDRRAVRR